jgi:hypothetical protein
MHDTPKVCGVNWVRFPKKNKSEVSNQLDNHRSNVLQNSGANAANAASIRKN